MQCKWIITRYGQDEDIQRLAYAVEETGRKAEIKSLKQMVEDFLDNPSQEKDCVVVTGTCTITRNMSRCRPQFYPGCWHNPDIMKCSNYYAHWGKHITQQGYAFYPLGEIKRLRDEIYDRFGVPDQYGDGKRVFIRPDEGEKIFTGEIVSLYYWKSWLDMLEMANVPNNTLCVVSKPLKIAKELRLIVRRGKVVTGSTYRMSEVIEYNALEDLPDKERIVEFAETVCKDAFPDLPPVFCFDIAIEENDRISLLEIGAVNCAGYYSCDLKKIVTAMSEEAEAEWNDLFS